MGDGGVACVTSQLIMEQFSICGTNTNGKMKLKTSPKSSGKVPTKVKPKMKVKKVKGCKLVPKISDLSKEVAEKVCNGEASSNNNDNNSNNKDEVEEGELGTLPLPPIKNVELVPEKPSRRYEIKSEIKKGEFIPGMWRKNSGEQERKHEWRSSKDDFEKSEFVSDRWCRNEVGYKDDDYSYSKVRRYDFSKEKRWKWERDRTSPSAKERGWKFERDSEWISSSGRDEGWRADYDSPPPPPPPSSGKEKWTPPSSDKYSSGNQHSRKFTNRYEGEKTPQNISKISGEEGTFKNDFSNGKIHGSEYPFNNRLKRHGNDSDSNDRKYRVEYDEYSSSSKNRKLSDDGSRFSSNHYSGKPYKNVPPSSSRNIPSERFSSRHFDSSRGVNDRRISSPHQSERSPLDRARNNDWARSPARRDRSKSPYDRSRHYDNRYHSPSYENRYHSPSYGSRSPPDVTRYRERRESNRKAGVGDRRTSDFGSKGKEGKYGRKDFCVNDSQSLTKESQSLDNGIFCDKKTVSNLVPSEELQKSPVLKGIDSSQENGITEDPVSMEEDMDICNTPPHVHVMVDPVRVAISGKWYYLDQFGEEQGPSNLSDLKTLMGEGYLASDHFIKHSDTDRWMTVENAVSPLSAVNFPSIVPDTVTQLVCPPEASGNLLNDNTNGSPDHPEFEEIVDQSSHPTIYPEGISAVEDFLVDERIGALLQGITLVPGREFEMIAEVLQMTIEHGDLERWGKIESYVWHQLHATENDDGKDAKGFSTVSEDVLNDIAESRPSSSERDNTSFCGDSGELFSGQWAVKGGDWIKNDEALPNRTSKRKVVLNDCYPLCQMPNSGCEDPRWQRKDELYYPSQSRRLDLPSWAFNSLDELNDPKSSQNKTAPVKGVKGVVLPVVRINSCVVSDHGSFVSEPRIKGRAKGRYSGKALQPYSATGGTKRVSEDSHSKSSQEHDSQESWKRPTSFSMPKDRLCKVDELQLHLGDWYYLDGTGHEQGPLSFSELQAMSDQRKIQKDSSIFRKHDKLWVPVTSTCEPSGFTGHENNVSSLNSLPEANISLSSENPSVTSRFHCLHPQFIGYTRGKLHELVMKSFKSREFAAAINAVLEPWINARQPKKETEKYSYLSDHSRASKRARIGGFEVDYEMEDSESSFPMTGVAFDDLCGDTSFGKDELVSEVQNESWDLLDGHVLARVFHFLRADYKSLLYASLTCKNWQTAVKFYKDISRHVDFCTIAPNCSESLILNVMNDYSKDRITTLSLRGCSAVNPNVVEELLQSFHCLSSIDIRGCTQLEDLVSKFPNIKWIKSVPPQLKSHSLNHMVEKSSSVFNKMEYSSGLKEYLESSNKRDSANQLFRRSLYKRSKLFDARKSSSILSRDAQLRRLAMKKSGNGYKRMEEFIASSIRDIMRENTFEFFETKVAELEERMKNGYYTSRGLNSVKEDISRMCRDAIKKKNQGDTRDMNRIITLFIRLATNLEQGSKLAYGGDAMMKPRKDESPPGFTSAYSKYKKNPSKVSERKHLNRSNSSSFFSGVLDSGDYATDREIRRRLSKLNKHSLDSGSDTTDEFDKSSVGSLTDGESTASDTESDPESQSTCVTAESKSESYFATSDGFESFADDREWGARMTKASLVPPVTRKYEVIDHYVIVADEEEVRKKMQVSLPEDYDEKLIAQRNGTEESDMEIPEVKDYKPRKSVGDEVIEQEVYGIDPYTHNLLLDSMPDDSDWSLLEKHLFIEDVMLQYLNKQVRNFTGSGNTPMIYPLKPVFEQIFSASKENHDKRTLRACQFILKAIDARPEDNYVAYRKGLGVVCNKEGGFSEDDFVVEFLGEVYPTWKWFEKQDGIRALQKNNNEAPEFYNIYLERPKGDADGYDLVVVDAMHKANYASRICHSCKPNCEAKVTAVDGHYQIGIYSVRPIAFGEEITFDYNSVTESKEEYEASVCLCGNQVCRGSYLNLTGEGSYQKVLKEFHGVLDRHHLLLEACELNSVSEEDYIDLGRAGLGSCLLGGLPDWLIAYAARLVRFINFERTKLPNAILRHNLEEKKKYYAEIRLDVEKSDAEIQAEGVYNQRLQNLALTIDKVRYVMRCGYGDPKNAPLPLERLSPTEAVSHIWKGDGSFVEELLLSMAPHVEDTVLMDLKSRIRSHDPSDSDDIEMGLHRSLLWLRDEVRNLPCTYKSRHDAAADLIHIYAYTKSFFKINGYKTITSPPVTITPLDLGPKYAGKLGSGVHQYCKSYNENYCLGQLMFWHNQNAEPDATLMKASRGCLFLPDVGSFYAKVQKPSRQRVYGPKTVKFMVSSMEKQPQRPWPKDKIWSFKTNLLRVIGSPMLDAVLHDGQLDREMVHWLKHRPAIFHAKWDR